MAVKSLKDLKALQNSRIEKLKSADTKTTKSYEKDTTFWQPTADENGNGSAEIRFLPETMGEDNPSVEIWEHAFKGPGGWYIENCRTTMKGEKDPVTELTNRLWASEDKSNIALAREMKRKHYYISNILVVKDAKNPEAEGKVFKYKYGQKIYDKIKDKREPQFDDEQAVDVFDPWNGANFKLKIRKVEGQRNFDKSEFADPTSLGSDAEIDAIWKMQHKLADIVAPENFKPYKVLEDRLLKVLGPHCGTGIETVEGGTATRPVQAAKPQEQRTVEAPARPVTKPVHISESTDDDDDDLALFNRLANGE